MSASRYLRALPLPPHLLPLHYHFIRTLGIKGPLSTAALFDTLADDQKVVSWRQPSIQRNPARPMREEELNQLTAQFGKLAIQESKELKANVTRSFFKSKIIMWIIIENASKYVFRVPQLCSKAQSKYLCASKCISCLQIQRGR